MVKLESFRDMLTAVGSFGPALRPPSYHDIRVPLLTNELAYTEELLKPQGSSGEDLDAPLCLMVGQIENKDP